MLLLALLTSLGATLPDTVVHHYQVTTATVTTNTPSWYPGQVTSEPVSRDSSTDRIFLTARRFTTPSGTLLGIARDSIQPIAGHHYSPADSVMMAGVLDSIKRSPPHQVWFCLASGRARPVSLPDCTAAAGLVSDDEMRLADLISPVVRATTTPGMEWSDTVARSIGVDGFSQLDTLRTVWRLIAKDSMGSELAASYTQSGGYQVWDDFTLGNLSHRVVGSRSLTVDSDGFLLKGTDQSTSDAKVINDDPNPEMQVMAPNMMSRSTRHEIIRIPSEK